MTYLHRSIFLPKFKEQINENKHRFKRRFNMTIYREFENSEKTMQEIVKEIVKRYIMLQYCNFATIDIESDKQKEYRL